MLCDIGALSITERTKIRADRHVCSIAIGYCCDRREILHFSPWYQLSLTLLQQHMLSDRSAGNAKAA